MYFFLNLFVALMENNYDSFVLASRSTEASTENQYLIVRRRLQATTKKINLIDQSNSQPYKLLLENFRCSIQKITVFFIFFYCIFNAEILQEQHAKAIITFNYNRICLDKRVLINKAFYRLCLKTFNFSCKLERLSGICSSAILALMKKNLFI